MTQAEGFHYTLSLPDPSSGSFIVELSCRNPPADTLELKMVRWSPGYYQIMDYALNLSDLQASDAAGRALEVISNTPGSWQIVCGKKAFSVSYKISTGRRFVAENFVDSDHAYILPAASFLYAGQFLKEPVSLRVEMPQGWHDLATGLEENPEKSKLYKAPNTDVLFDCPILMGNLEDLPSFEVKGIKHRFTGYDMADFDREALMDKLHQAIETATSLMGDIPYTEYTFIGIGQGFGGIEHQNSTAVSFTGEGLDDPQNMLRTLSFLIHEYFHLYNVKRIRPFELGPFDYSRENRTNLLWVSEGLTVYYEYLILKRAGLMSEEQFFRSLAGHMEASENDPGRFYQSLAEASYSTWSDGPFGQQGGDDRSISVYDKGTCMGLILDLAIRTGSGNSHSLDDVMRRLYSEYYQKQERGFTDAEFRQTCEEVAGVSLGDIFEYVYSTAEPAYERYLSGAGLKLSIIQNKPGKTVRYSLTRTPNPDPQQQALIEDWLN
ncbi:MAG: M61 family peptidase [Bacteroidota bacterium]